MFIILSDLTKLLEVFPGAGIFVLKLNGFNMLSNHYLFFKIMHVDLFDL